MGEGLLDLLSATRRQWRLAAAIAIPLVIGAFVYTESLPAEYEAVAVVGFAPRDDQNPSADVVRLLLPKYTVFVSSTETVRRVGADLGVDPDTLDKGLEPSIPGETATLRITFCHTSPSLAADAANEFADEAIDFARADSVVAASLVARALSPVEPAGPPRRLIEAAALVVALAAGLGAGLIVERGRPRIRSMADVANATGLRVLGRMPRDRAFRSPPLEALVDPIIGSVVRSARTNIDRESRDAPVHALAVTSATAGEGKTTFATLFAAALARLEADVLLLDADLVRPQLARRFGLEDDPGLNDVLRKTRHLGDVVHDVAQGLHVVTATPDAAAGDLVARMFGEVLSEARSSFDVVVVDAPPIVGTDLGGTISALAEAVVVVVQSGTFTAPVRQAVAELNGNGARVLGVIANGVPDPAESYYVTDKR